MFISSLILFYFIFISPCYFYFHFDCILNSTCTWFLFSSSCLSFFTFILFHLCFIFLLFHCILSVIFILICICVSFPLYYSYFIFICISCSYISVLFRLLFYLYLYSYSYLYSMWFISLLCFIMLFYLQGFENGLFLLPKISSRGNISGGSFHKGFPIPKPPSVKTFFCPPGLQRRASRAEGSLRITSVLCRRNPCSKRIPRS